MQQLPDEFNSSVDVLDRDLDADNMQRERINAGERESASHHVKKQAMQPILVIVIAVALSLLMNTALLVATTDKPLAKMTALFGIKTKSSDTIDAQQVAINQLNATIAEHTDLLAQSNTAIKAVGEYVADIKSSTAELGSKVMHLENRTEEAVNEINRLKIQRVTPKKVVITKPKEPPKPQIFVSLVSVRHQGGNSWVTLREGFDTSPLMAVGDEWRAVKLISADTNNKSAQLMINGTLTVMKL